MTDKALNMSKPSVWMRSGGVFRFSPSKAMCFSLVALITLNFGFQHRGVASSEVNIMCSDRCFPGRNWQGNDAIQPDS